MAKAGHLRGDPLFVFPQLRQADLMGEQYAAPLDLKKSDFFQVTGDDAGIGPHGGAAMGRCQRRRARSTARIN